MDSSLAIAGISTGIVSIILAIFTHLKHSTCFGITIDTYSPSEIAQQTQPQNIIINTPPNTPAHTPEQNHKQYSNESSI